jgi:hypothetical protein
MTRNCWSTRRDERSRAASGRHLGAVATESGLRPAAAQLDNRVRRFGLRLLSLPQDDQAKEAVGAGSEIGKAGERTGVLLGEPEALDAEMMQEDEAAAKAEAERSRRGLTMFTDGSRLNSGASGHSIAW